jgi:ParB-like chromosome segregation protein Spo0J
VTKTKAKTKLRARSVAPAAPAEPVKASLPAYVVETWSLDRIKPYARNARKHSATQIEQLRGSFKKFGQVWPLLVREDGTIIAGHGRLEAAKLEGLTEVRVIVAAGWSPEQCRAFGLLDNKVALNSSWDETALGLEIADLSGLGVPLGEIGFTELEVGELFGDKDNEEKAPRKPHGDLNPVIQFNIVFDDEGQQQRWFGFVRQLKTKYPDDETLGSRLAKFIAEQTVAAG